MRGYGPEKRSLCLLSPEGVVVPSSLRPHMAAIEDGRAIIAQDSTDLLRTCSSHGAKDAMWREPTESNLADQEPGSRPGLTARAE